MEYPNRICKRCLLKEVDAEYFESLSIYINSIDEDLKVGNVTYKERLDICQECDKLVDGMCSGCGCYVELRGIMKKNKCPYDKWL
ncbi:DUF6171 family protein [Vallitalea okinawensis]|uniref:DUF6171 family protein n=1 Tax=Vallitalea okinawensis TaxID=2078660 RepID=UPI001FA8D3FC|nr:DUF6171 family protein [Vallitalea okinawensis]